MASVVSICNSALNQLGAASITALTDNSKNARLCNERYETVRDAVFTLPSDSLGVLVIDAYNSDYKVEGRKILCNEKSIKISYISQVTDPNEMDVLLRETIAAGIAADIAYAITANLQVSKLMQEKYQYKLSEARHADASEGYNIDPSNGQVDQILTEDFINSRY